MVQEGGGSKEMEQGDGDGDVVEGDGEVGERDGICTSLGEVTSRSQDHTITQCAPARLLVVPRPPSLPQPASQPHLRPRPAPPPSLSLFDVSFPPPAQIAILIHPNLSPSHHPFLLRWPPTLQ